MLALIIATATLSLFGLTVKYAERRSCNLLAVGAVNYAAGAVIYGSSALGTGPPSRATWLLGVAGGILFATAYVFLARIVGRKGISISTAVLQLSALFPVLAGLSLWGDQPTWTQGLGVVLAMMALPLLGIAGSGEARRIDGRVILLTGALLAANGGCLLVIQSFHFLGAASERRLFFTVIFSVATVVSTSVWWFFRKGSSRRDVAPGILLGVWNSLAGFMMLSAMKVLPGTVVFPFSSSVALALTTLVAVCVWRERLSRSGKVGMALTLAAVVCINIGRG